MSNTYKIPANEVGSLGNGTAIVVLPCGTSVLMDETDLDRLERMGCGPIYLVRNSQNRMVPMVDQRTAGVTTAVPLVRVVANTAPGMSLRYANGSRLDLRRMNLVTHTRAMPEHLALQFHAAMHFPKDLDARAAWLALYGVPAPPESEGRAYHRQRLQVQMNAGAERSARVTA